MLKTLLGVLAETFFGIVIAGLVLAMAVPALAHYDLIDPGGVTGSIVVTGVLVLAIGSILFRPGSALNRYVRR